ncbi:MAG: hypothetical protein KatS3mg102_1685 [Planctomycetota bacterium]|nr:MAG: hypothetical protein KatS3mg102_1685 [Planctomycetota bacterium]
MAIELPVGTFGLALALLGAAVLACARRPAGRRPRLQLGLRLAVAVMLAAAIAGPHLAAPGTGTRVVLEDVSLSFALRRQRAAELLARLEAGARAARGGHSPAWRTLHIPFAASAGGSPDPRATDLGAALAAGLAALGGAPGDLVLLSDGRATAPGALLAAERAAALGVRIHALCPPPLELPAAGITALRGPARARAEAPLVIEVHAGWNGRHAPPGRPHGAPLEVRLAARLPGGRTLARLAAELPAFGGERAVRLELPPPAGWADAQALASGLVRLEVALEHPLLADPCPEDERVPLAVLLERDRPRLLVVGPDQASGDGGRAAAAFGAWLEQGGIAHAVPASAAELAAVLGGGAAEGAGFEAVALVELPAAALAPDALAALVRHLEAGGGVLVLGARHAFGPGGYAGTALQELLPLAARPEAERERALVLLAVLDRSGSMGQPFGPGASKLAAAVRALGELAGALGRRDRLGLVAFAERPELLRAPAPAPPPAQLVQALAGLEAGGGTELFGALEVAIARARQAGAELADGEDSGAAGPLLHVVVLTDGRSDRTPDPEAALERVAALAAAPPRVTISAVAIGPDADRELLRRLVQRSGGAVFEAAGAAELGQALRAAARPGEPGLLLQGRFALEPGPAAQAFGLGAEAFAGTVTALARTRLRPAAALLAAARGAGPLAAVWEHRGGRVAAYATAEIAAAPAVLRALVQQVAGPPADALPGVRAWRELLSGGARAVVDLEGQGAAGRGRALVLRLPGAAAGSPAELPLVETAPARYESPPLGPAAGELGLVLEPAAAHPRLARILLAPPLAESALDTPDLAFLRRITALSGGQLLRGAPGEQLLPPPAPAGPTTSLAPALALLAAALFVLERLAGAW